MDQDDVNFDVGYDDDDNNDQDGDDDDNDYDNDDNGSYPNDYQFNRQKVSYSLSLAPFIAIFNVYMLPKHVHI